MSLYSDETNASGNKESKFVSSCDKTHLSGVDEKMLLHVRER